MWRNITGKPLASEKRVMRRGVSVAEEYESVEVELVCPLVTARAHVAMTDVLPVEGVGFLLGYDVRSSYVPHAAPCGNRSGGDWYRLGR